MEDKYQQALDTLAHIDLQVYGSYEDELDTYLTTGETLTPLPAGLCYLDEFKALQELIDKYNSMCGDYMSYQDLKAEYEQEIAKLEKALNFTCEKLGNVIGIVDSSSNKEPKEQWLEYAFKESEK